MKKLLCILLILACTAASAQTPAKPQADQTDGNVLTAAWLNSMFGTIYTWAQGTNASVTLLLSGVSSADYLTASRTTSVASAVLPLTWDATNLDHVTMAASGAYAFDASIIAVATSGADMARFVIQGVVISNSTSTSLISDAVKSSWFTNPAYDVTATSTVPGQLRLLASSPANVKWKARLEHHELGY